MAENQINNDKQQGALVVGCIILIGLFLLIVSNSSKQGPSDTRQNSYADETSASTTIGNDPSVIIPSVFLGDYTWEEIQPRLHYALKASGEPNPEEKYLNIASGLIELRKAASIPLTEMMILERAIGYYEALSGTESKLKITDAMALAAVELEIE